MGYPRISIWSLRKITPKSGCYQSFEARKDLAGVSCFLISKVERREGSRAVGVGFGIT